MKILIVDDSRAMQTIVRRGIEQLGYDNIDIKKADNGHQALDIIRVWEPELVLSDWHMPEMTGMELLQSLNRQMLGVTIGFVTTESSETRIQQALDSGAKFVVQKPFDFKTLHEAVLPIIQGCFESEKTLHESQEEKNIAEHIVLPSATQLQEKINQTVIAQIQFKEVGPIKLDTSHGPYVLGLYSDARQKAVHAVAIADLRAACTLAASMGNISEENIHIILAERALPKMVIENCRKIFKATETILLNDENQTHLTLRSANVMPKNNESVEKLLEKSGQERLDVGIKIPGLDPGRLTFIVS